MDLNGTRCPPAAFTPPRRLPVSPKIRSALSTPAGMQPGVEKRGFANAHAGPGPCATLVSRHSGRLLAVGIKALYQLHVQAQRLQLADQDVEGLGHARLNGGLALHDGLIDLA